MTGPDHTIPQHIAEALDLLAAIKRTTDLPDTDAIALARLVEARRSNIALERLWDLLDTVNFTLARAENGITFPRRSRA